MKAKDFKNKNFINCEVKAKLRPNTEFDARIGWT